MGQNKYPCALLMSDIHVSKDNIPEFHRNWDEALEICKNRGIEEIIIGGDLWKSTAAQTLDVLLAAKDAIERATRQGITLTIAEGNHDLVDKEALLGYSHLFDGYLNVDVIGDYTILEFNDCTLFVMSYFPENGSFIARLKDMVSGNEKLDRPWILYIHEGIRGGLAQPSDDELPTSIFKDFDTVLVGHYHDRKKIPGTNIEYVGSSRQHNFGEDEEKGYIVLYDDGSYEFVKNEVNTRFKNIDVRCDELGEEFNKSLAEIVKDKRYKTKVRVSCYSEETGIVDKQKLIDAGATKVEIITEQTEVAKVEAHSLEQKFDKSGIKEEYKAFCANKEISNDMGLKYLDRIN